MASCQPAPLMEPFHWRQKLSYCDLMPGRQTKSMTFDELIAPLDRERFFSDHWSKSFLHIRGSKGRFGSYLDWEKLNQVLEWHSPPPLLKLFREGNPIDPHHFIDNMDKAPEYRQINAGRLIASLTQGCQMVIDGIQKNVPEIRDLSEEFEHVFQAPNLVNLYAGWGTQNAFHLHWDPQEVFILQLSGRKHWKVYAPTRPFPLQDDDEKAKPPQGQPAWEGVVEDGDLLYLPRGFWHVVRPIGEPSLHLNIGLEMATGLDFLRWWLPRLIRRAEVRADMPLLGSPAGQDYTARLLALMTDDARQQDLAGDFLREWNAFRRVRPRLRLPVQPVSTTAFWPRRY